MDEFRHDNQGQATSDQRHAPAGLGLRGFALRVAIAVLVTAVITGLLLVFWYGIEVFLLAFAGFLFGLALATPARWLEKTTGLRYGWCLTLVVLVLAGLTALVLRLLTPHVATQVPQLAQRLPESVDRFTQDVRRYPWGQAFLDQMPRAGQAARANLFAQITGFVSSLFGSLVDLVVILIAGLYGAAEPELYRAGLLHLVPAARHARVREVVDVVCYTLRWWLFGQLIAMVIIGVLTGVGLWALGIPLALSLGLIAGLAEMVPTVGPFLSAIPALMLALLVGPWHVLGVLGLYLVLHLFEGYLLLPMLQRRTVLLPPALTILVQILFAALIGPIGLLVAAPLTAAALVLIKMLYVEDTLGDVAVEVPGEPGNEARPGAGAARVR